MKSSGLLVVFFLLCATQAFPQNLDTLAASPTWLTLGHWYREGPSYKSAVDDDSFFLSTFGATDPKSELKATIEAFRNPQTVADTVCKYPARAHYLRTYIPSLIKPKCEKFKDWWKQIAPESITLVFPSAYINNPASTFGHTLLRINATHGDPLLAYSTSYAASTNGENAILYALKGVFGGYYGEFSLGPYYKRVSKYSEIENRDIWEYDLDLTKPEVEQLVRHLWEIKSVKICLLYTSPSPRD